MSAGWFLVRAALILSSFQEKNRHYDYDTGAKPAPRSKEIAPEFEDLAAEFATTIAINQHTEAFTFIKSHPSVLKEQYLDTKYLDEAVRRLRHSDRVTAASFVEKYIFIDEVRKNGKYLQLLREKDAPTVGAFKERFRKLSQECQRRADVRPAQPSQTASQRRRKTEEAHDLDDTTARVTEIAIDETRPTVAAGNPRADLSNRHFVSKDFYHYETDDVAPQLSTKYPVVLNRHASAGGEIDDRGEGDKISGARRPRTQSVSTVDSGFQSLPLKKWRLFEAGLVFLRKTYDEDNAIREDVSSGGIITKTRPMVVVSPQSGFCHAVPVYSYGGKGLSKSGLRDSNIKAHAVIHMEGTSANWLQGEPPSGKRPITVRPFPNNSFTFDRSSRINFERPSPVDYNTKIILIGTVTRECMAYLTGYWAEEVNKGKPKNSNRHTLQNPLNQAAQQGQHNRHSGRQGRQMQQEQDIQQGRNHGQQAQQDRSQGEQIQRIRYEEEQLPRHGKEDESARKSLHNEGQLPRSRHEEEQASRKREEERKDSRSRHEVEPPVRNRNNEEQASRSRNMAEQPARSLDEEEQTSRNRYRVDEAPRRRHVDEQRPRRPHEGGRVERTQYEDEQAQRSRQHRAHGRHTGGHRK